MKSAFAAAVALIMGIASLSAKDKAPGGYQHLSELDAARAEAKGSKLIVVLVKGRNDACPHCDDAVKAGQRAIGSGVVKVFARAETLNSANLAPTRRLSRSARRKNSPRARR